MRPERQGMRKEPRSSTISNGDRKHASSSSTVATPRRSAKPPDLQLLIRAPHDLCSLGQRSDFIGCVVTYGYGKLK